VSKPRRKDDTERTVTMLDLVRQRDWSLVVLDISMPGRNGLELIKLIQAERPRLPVLIFSMHHEEQYAVRAIRAGARGYLSKEGAMDLLLPAMRRLAQGGRYISPKVAELLAMVKGAATVVAAASNVAPTELHHIFRIRIHE
jgi:DNA-binding NarL/FixJ family response regulator